MVDVKVERSIDADTDWVTLPDGTREKVRQKYAASFESVASTTNKGKISARGKKQSQQSKALVRPGDTLSLGDEEERGIFGRRLEYPTKKFGGKDVAVGFLKSSLGVNDYYTKYGRAPKEIHETMKSTYNKYLPYQFSDPVQMPVEEFNKIGTSMAKITEQMNLVASNQATPELLDELIAETYGEGGDKRVAEFLNIRKQLEIVQQSEEGPLTAEKIIRQSFQDPEMQAAWDKAVISKEGSDDIRLSWTRNGKSFMDEASATLQVYNDVANFVDRAVLYASMHDDLKITDEVLAEVTATLPKEVQSRVTDEAAKYGNARASIFAQQLRQDINSHEIFDDMGFMKQFAYGAGSLFMSPTSLLIGGKAVQVASKTTKAIKGWEASNVLKGYAYTKTWTAAAGVEAVAMNAPRLVGDHTYTPRDLLIDITLDTTMGAALPLTFMGGSKFLKPIVKDFVNARTTNKMRAPKDIEGDLINEQGREKAAGTTGEQLDDALRRRTTSKRSQRVREAEDIKHGKATDGTTKGDTSTSADGAGISRGTDVNPPIGGRASVIADDGIVYSQGEIDAEVSISSNEMTAALQGAQPLKGRPIINNTPWQQKVSGETAEEIKAATQRLQDLGEPIGKPKELTQNELDVMAAQQRAEDITESWVDSGLDAQHVKASKPLTMLEKVGQGMANLTGKAMSHRMQASTNPVMRFIGFNFLEDPKGFAGRIRRGTTAALRSTNEKNLALSKIMPHYAKNIDEWSQARGAMFHERFKAAWGTPDGDKIASEFRDQFIDAINARKMGRNIDVDPTIGKMLDDWEKFMDYNHMRALNQKLPGWDKKRKNYFPQMRNNQKMQNFINKTVKGSQQLKDLFNKGMTNSRDAGLHTLDDETIDKLADQMVKQAETGQKDLPEATSTKLARAQSRVEMDWTATAHDLKLSDFLETDIALIADRYTSDLSGRLALSRVTRGKISTDADIAGLKDIAYAKHAEAIDGLTDKGQIESLNKKFQDELQMMDDSINMILGRPPRGGLAPELRHLKQFTMLTRMGILGTSQSIETGNIIARSTIDLFSDPSTVKHLFAMSGDSVENKALMQDIMNITGRTKDMEYLFRPSQVLDEEQMKSLSNLRQMSTMLADKATGGDLKQPASRILSKTSMFNWVQKNQSEFVQKSFLIHTDRYFNTGKSAISVPRMIDLGMINKNGTNTELSNVFKNIVKKNEHGHIVDLQWNKWSKKAKEQYMDAAQRDEAQRLQQTFAGEAPAYYNKPLMNLLFQFREVPLVAQNKQMARNMAFGDVEAASSVMLNLAIAGVVRYGWLSGLGFAKAVVEGETDDFRLPGLNQLDIQRYMASGGMLPDAIETGIAGFRAYNQQDPSEVLRQIPQFGVLKDGMDFATGDNENNNRAEAMQGLTLCGNTWWMDIIHTMFVDNVNKMANEEQGE